MSEDQIKAELDRYLEAFSENRTVLPETNRNNTRFIIISNLSTQVDFICAQLRVL